MKKIYFDTDVILDVLTEREPYCIWSAKCFSLVDNKKVRAYTSSLVFANLFYILRKMTSAKKARETLRTLKGMVRIANVDASTIDRALDSDFKDFEDAIQHYCALDINASCLLTRNKKDFKGAHLPILSPEDFLHMYFA